MKQNRFWLLGVLMALAGCGGDDPDPDPTQTPAPVVLTSDSFNRATFLPDTDAAFGGAAMEWQALGPMSTGLAQNAATSEGLVLAAVESGYANCSVQVKLASVIVSGKEGLIAFRVMNDTNMMWVSADDLGNFKLSKRVTGTDTTIASTALTPAVGDTVRVEFYDSAIKVKLNGVEKLTADDSTHSTRTMHGLFATAAGVAWDDFVIEDCR